MKFSIIIPVFNRPEEIDELLDSLTKQTYREFEVLVIEDGSTNRCEGVVEKYKGMMEIRYFEKENSGQGFTRNYGYQKATGDYYIVFDSDCIIPPEYLSVVESFLKINRLDAYGGPDRAHESFTHIQKAINYAMTSLFTTGGTRGSKFHIGQYLPRSFNMGISPGVFKNTGGYIITRMAEDLEFSIRIRKSGFTTGFIEEAFVYHKRRTSLWKFFEQIHFFGRGRINLTRFFPGELKPVHFFPLLFDIGLAVLIILPFVNLPLFYAGLTVVVIYFLIVWAHALAKSGNMIVSLLSVIASLILLAAYGTGFVREGIKKIFYNKIFL
ncbi:MAG TPA: glycosyltransferase [Cyclobacteriaceae bacterium]|nr:glycosyltransferase [Cyclobacteriaceae bacterium]